MTRTWNSDQIDGILLIGNVFLIQPNASLDGNSLKISWKVVDHTENVSVVFNHNFI